MGRLLLPFALLLFWLQGCALISENSGPADCRSKLYDTPWQLRVIDNDPVVLKFPATLEIAPDGKIGGFDGCNRYFGKADISATEITFGPIGSTRRFCMGPSGDVEKAMLGMFKGTKWWQFDEKNRLVIFDDEHRLIFDKRH